MNSHIVSIGILSYKRTDLLLDTLRDLSSVTQSVELVLLNNNEDMDILNEVSSLLDGHENLKLNYIWDRNNYGVSSGRRRLIEACTGRWMILLDDDVAIPDINRVVTDVIGEFESAPTTKAIAFNIVEHDTGMPNRYEIPHKNKAVDLSSAFDTYLIIGAGNALDVQAVRDVGNFPDDFGLYGFEEIDVAFRLINAGWKIRYLPSCVVKHKKSPDGRFSNHYVSRQCYVNRVVMARRYLSLPYVVSCFVVRTVFLLKQTGSLSLVVSAAKESFRGVEVCKFDRSFYSYIKKVNGFIWW
jgi:GT2 family glycosyltransferase